MDGTLHFASNGPVRKQAIRAFDLQKLESLRNIGRIEMDEHFEQRRGRVIGAVNDPRAFLMPAPGDEFATFSTQIGKS